MDERTVADQSYYYSTVRSTHGPTRAPSRLPYWAAFFLFSLITLGSTIEATDRVQITKRGVWNQKWAVACAVIIFFIATIMIAFHVGGAGAMIVGSKLELASCLISIPVASILVGLISDIRNGLAVDLDGGVTFGNLYYFGWAAFAISVVLMVDYCKAVFMWEVMEQMRNRSTRLDGWLTFLTSNLVLMGSAANLWDFSCLEDKGRMYCNRTLLAIVLGVTGSVVSIVLVGMKFSAGFAPLTLELVVCGLLFLAHCFSIALVTSEFGPGAKIGNLYYSSWLTLITSFGLVASCHTDYVATTKEGDVGESTQFYATNNHDGDATTVGGKSFAERSYFGTKPTMMSSSIMGKGGKYADEASMAEETTTHASMWK